jgi:signal transduction histidine kinase
VPTQLTAPNSNHRRRWALTVAVTLLIPLLELISAAIVGRRDNWWRFGYFALETPLLMFVLTLHHQWLERQGRLRILRTVGSSVVISTAVGAGTALTYILGLRPLGFPVVDDASPTSIMVVGGVIGIVMCGIWTIGFLYPFTEHTAGLRTLELEAHKLESEKLKLEASQLRAAAELARIRSQLEPHFLLNTLNSIAGLVTQRPRDARRLLGCLGDLLRDVLTDGHQLQTLDLEVTWLERYAEILESRHAGFLAFRWHIDEQTRSALVPRLVLQPLLENAVNHGALRRPDGGEVSLRTSVAQSSSGSFEVVCVVEDNGPGIPDKPLRTGALGLRSVRRRLELEFEGATLDLDSSSGGTRAIVRLPLLLERSHAPSVVS